MRRRLAFVLAGSFALLLAHAPARAQVTEAERAAARDLFKEGDELQRAGKFVEALDKFQRAQRVFSAPTNLLRIAECDAALGKLVESQETYRTLVRTPLPAGSPPAFQAAVDQAKAELATVEPRVPKLVVQVEPKNVTNAQMQIDGQTVNAALIGEPLPLDPGMHKVLVFASGYASSEQQVTLREHDAKTLPVTLKPIAGLAYANGGAGETTPPSPPPPASTTTTTADSNALPPPPPVEEGHAPPAPKKSRTGLLVGGHIGFEAMAGEIPWNGSTRDATTVSPGGTAYGVDVGLRFARTFYVGLAFDSVSLASPAATNSSILDFNGQAVRNVSSSSYLLSAILGLILSNPDKFSVFLEGGIGDRSYSLTSTNQSTNHTGTDTFTSAEFLLGGGLWIPLGRSLRVLPKIEAGISSFSAPNGSSAPSGSGMTTTSTASSPSQSFAMIGVTGFYNVDFK